MIENLSDQAESTTKPTGGGNLKPFPSWVLLVEAVEGYPLVMMGAHGKIAVGGTRLTQSVIPIDMPCTILHNVTCQHLLVEMVQTFEHQPEMAEAIELDINLLVHLFLPYYV